MHSTTQEITHDNNLKLVLTHIINEGPISRATLAQQLGLTKATISALVQKLIDKHLVLELGSDNTARGRKPILLTFNSECGHVISINLEEKQISILSAYLTGESAIITYAPNYKSKTEIISHLIATLENVIQTLPPTPHGVVGICIGIHGVVCDNKILFTPYSLYSEVDFVTALGEHFNIPIYLENEANLSIIGEKTFYYNYANMVGISIHSGIGLGLIINHQLFVGYNGNAGEFGHTIVEPNGIPCPCGNHGCLEQYASERALLLSYNTAHGTNASLEEFIEAYHQGDATACALIEQFIQYMSIGINNILNFFNPEVIVFNSPIVTALPNVLDEIETRLKNRMKNYCRLLPSGLTNNAILVGGVCICTQNFLELKYLSMQFSATEEL